MFKQPALAPSPQPRPAPTTRALPAEHADQRGPFWRPIGGPSQTPIDTGLTDVDLAAFGEHLRTCRCPRAKGGRRNHHTIYGARLFRRHLVELGLCRSAAVGAVPAEPQLVADFKTWLTIAPRAAWTAAS